ncbi:hypothetical protein [Ruania halotolerans]|uniref:hypothetical protein n=1 Tax=Ruania halotolerans TaxID=2897773 RepID=UPI001E3A0557|nr:hypothetical protein [Ruania halotolerans]UFU08174.1 hypothetical protein LQF10_08805 [Ruania halotolerans]
MAFAWVRPQSQQWIEAQGNSEVNAVQADQAAALLRSDYERWSRWGLGVASFLGTSAGAVTVGLAADAVTQSFTAFTTAEQLLVAGIAVVGLLLASASSIVLVRLWRTGRRLVRASIWWMKLPYTRWGRRRHAAGWIEARTVNFEPTIYARIATGSLAFLAGIFGLSMLFAPAEVRGDFTGMVTAFAVVGTLGISCGLGQIGGVMGIVSGVSERDPLWVRIRSAFQRS